MPEREAFHQIKNSRFSPDTSIPIINTFTSIADDSAYSLSAADDSEKTLYQHPDRKGQRQNRRVFFFRKNTNPVQFQS
jgi:hypothetical protein